MVRSNRSNRRNRRRNTNNRRRTGRRIASRITKIATNAPMRANLPADPPALNATNTSSHIIPMAVDIASSGTAVVQTLPGYGGIGRYTTYATTGSIVTVGITINNLHKAVCSRYGFDVDVAAEYALRKVAYWGPTAAQQGSTRDIRPSLIVDMGTVSGGICVNDVGTEMHRARCGVTLPVSYWYPSTSTTEYILLKPDQAASYADVTMPLGYLYLTVERKGFPTS